jgi:hypothetical protein
MNICDRKLTKQIVFCVVAAGILFTKTVSGVAALIAVDDPVFGPASVTADTTTGLEWLDLTQTTNLSHLQMTALLASDVRFEGWRYAASSEVESLFTDAGISLLCCSAQNVVPVTNLQALLGVTVIQQPSPPSPLTLIGSLGYYGLPILNSNPPLANFDLLEIQVPIDGAAVAGVQLGLMQPLDFASPGIGSYLVRTGLPAVPEPSSGILLLSALAAIAGYCRKIARKEETTEGAVGAVRRHRVTLSAEPPSIRCTSTRAL